MELRFDALLCSNLGNAKICCRPYQMLTRAAGSPSLI